MDLDGLAREVRAAQDACTQLRPFTTGIPGFDLAAAYGVADRIHRARVSAGAVPCGRKIGFTNASIWPEYDVHHPVWGWMYEHTQVDGSAGHAVVRLAGLSEPKIEPEIAFGLRTAPAPGVDVAQLLECIAWVAPAFEIVQSHFPGWKFRAPDTVADGGLHGRLVVGARVPTASLGPDPAAALAGLTVALECDGRAVEVGRGSNVLGSPLAALAHLVALLEGDAALRAGEVVTTGTVTAAYGIQAGQTWQAVPGGVALAPLAVAFTS